MSKLDFEQDVRIDRYALEEELENQSVLLYSYDEEMNEQKKILSQKELELSVTEAEIAYAIRQGTYGYEGKVTESVVKELVEKDLSVIDLRREVIEQKRVVNQTASAAEAIRQRRYMVQKLVDLYIYEYFNNVDGRGSRPSGANTDRVADDQINGLARRRREEALSDSEDKE